MIVKSKKVNPKGITGELIFGLLIADSIYATYVKELVITSLNDGIHGEWSFHSRDGKCNAADLRTSNVDDPKPIADRIRNMLHDDFDVVLEVDHIHLEYDPK